MARSGRSDGSIPAPRAVLPQLPAGGDAQLLAALGQRERFVESAALLADWDGPYAPASGISAMALALDPKNLIAPDRLIEMARQAEGEEAWGVWQQRVLGVAYYRAGRYRETLEFAASRKVQSERPRAIEAMAAWQLGQKSKARKMLAEADSEFEDWCRSTTQTGRRLAQLVDVGPDLAGPAPRGPRANRRPCSG